jgi:hypothetical protein
MHIQIAAELIDAIIDNFSHRWDLYSCALVCHEWLSSSRRHLFRHVDLFPPCHRYTRKSSDVPYSDRLYRVLIDSPNIVDYIKEVKVYEGQVIRSTDHTLPVLLRMLVKLEKLQFHRLNWTDFPEDLKQSICSVLELPTLSILEVEQGRFNGMGEFTSFLSHAKGLTHLSLTKHVTWSVHDTVEPKGQVPEHLKQSHLVNLRLELYNESLAQFTKWLLSPESPFAVSHIATLDISAAVDGTIFNPLLQAIGGSLKRCRFHALQYQSGELTQNTP